MIVLYPRPQMVQQMGEYNVSQALGGPLGPEKAEPTLHPINPLSHPLGPLLTPQPPGLHACSQWTAGGL